MTAGVVQEFGQAAALVLAAVFMWAAVAKARNLEATIASFRGLGLPGPAVLARTVLAVEAALALGLVIRPVVAAWPAVALLALFTIVVARAVARGAQVRCACFGSTSTRAVSSVELIRNAGLISTAVVASGAGTGTALAPTIPALVIVTILVALGRVGLAMGELRQVGGRVFATQLAGEPRR